MKVKGFIDTAVTAASVVAFVAGVYNLVFSEQTELENQEGIDLLILTLAGARPRGTQSSLRH